MPGLEIWSALENLRQTAAGGLSNVEFAESLARARRGDRAGGVFAKPSFESLNFYFRTQINQGSRSKKIVSAVFSLARKG